MVRSLQTKVVLAVSLVSFLGLSVLTLYINMQHENTISKQNKAAFVNVLNATALSVTTLMNSGYADLGDVLRESLLSLSEVMDIKVTRIDGTEAFLNNATVDAVNKKLGYEQFDTFRDAKTVQAILLPSDEIRAIAARNELYDTIVTLPNGTRYQTLILPVANEASCQKCHISTSPILGFIQLKTALDTIDEALNRSRLITFGIAILTLMTIMLVINIYVRRVILPPVAKLSKVIANITGQNLTETIELVSHVEFSRIANIFNLMVHRLSMSYGELTTERDKLATLLMDSREGIVVTDPYGKIVLANHTATTLLSKSETDIIKGGLSTLFDDFECPVARITEGSLGEVPTIEVPYRAQILQVQLAEVFAKNSQTVGIAAIFKDITEETQRKKALNKLARTDSLTGLFNRRHFDEVSQVELSRSIRYHHPISVMIVDIDHFKMVNDTQGHNVGDTVIQSISNVIKESIREFDLACRYGGEEFVILLPNTHVQDGYAFAERLRKIVEAWHLGDLRVTVSIGVAAAPPLPLTSIDQLIKSADIQLYKAKHAGRNQVMCQWQRDA